MSFRSEFSIDPGLIHLNNAGTAPLPKKTRETIHRLVNGHEHQGAMAIPGFFSELDRARETFGRFLGTEARHVAFSANLSTSVSEVAWGLRLSEGETILTSDQEYPSNAYVWLAVAKAKRLKVEAFPSNHDLSIDWDRFIEKIRPGVKLVVLSWVQYKAGTTAPLKRISQACHKIGAWFAVDGIQGLGVMPFHLQENEVDIICGGTHKWLCGLTGQGFLAFREELYMDMMPIVQGTGTYGTPEDPVRPEANPLPSARRFEAGAPSHISTIAAATSVSLIQEHGIETINQTAIALRDQLVEGLRESGNQILGSPAGDASSIVAFRGKNMEAVAETLKNNRVSYVLRTHGLRLSPHGFNTKDEIAQVLKWIRDVQK